MPVHLLDIIASNNSFALKYFIAHILRMKVRIYTTTQCPYCNMTKDFFKKNNVKYEEINVENDQKAAEEMIEKSGQMGVPVIDVDGEIIVGFNRPALEKALKMK